MHPNTYRIRLLFWHQDLNFTETQNELSVIPGIRIHRPMNAGEDRYSYTGKRLEGQYFDSRLGIDFETNEDWARSEERDSSDAVDGILETLRPLKDLLNDLADNGCSLSIIVSVGVDENTSVNVSPELAKKLSEFSMNLSYDLYPPDEVRTEPSS